MSSDPPRSRCGGHAARSPSPKSCPTRSNPHSVASVDIFTLRVTGNPVLLFLANKPPWRRPRDDSVTLLPPLPSSNAEGLSAQTVNDLVAMYVGAASQPVLRMRFVLEDEARTFDTEVIGFWSQLNKRDATSPVFHLPLKLGGLWCWLSCAAQSGCPLASLAIGAPNTDGSHSVPRCRHTSSPSGVVLACSNKSTAGQMASLWMLTAPLLWVSIRRRRRSLACRSGQMPR